VAPYLCYSRKDRRTKSRDPLTARYVAGLFEAMGTDRMVTVDVHNLAAYQNAYRIPTEHLTAASMFVDHFAPLVGDSRAVVVSPDAGGAKRADAFRQRLEQRLEREIDLVFIEKTRSEGVVRGGTVVGDVRDRIAIIVDDLISSGTTLARGAASCKERGAIAAYAAATHGVFSADASQKLAESALDGVAILDTVVPDRLDPQVRERHVTVLDSAPLLARAIHRLHTNGSIVELNEMISSGTRRPGHAGDR
jgi:ribose-phosphate pyrophosphokinase